MVFLINLLGAAALLLWGLRMVRTGVLRAFGSQLRAFLGKAMGNRVTALLGGLGATILLQSSSATALITSSFASRKVVGAAAALAIILGADVGTALVAQAYAYKVAWISPLLILAGWFMFNHLTDTRKRDLGRAIVGLGITLLGLQMISAAAEPMRDAPVVPLLLKMMADTPISGVIVGAALTIASTSSLAIILLIVSFATHALIPVEVAYALVLGANLGSGFLALLATGGASPQVRRLPLGNLIFKGLGAALAIPLLPQAHVWLQLSGGAVHEQVVWFHLGFNLLLALLFISFTGVVGRIVERVLPEPRLGANADRPRHLDPSALATPSLAISCAAREALHQADVVETMMRGILPVIRHNDLELAEQLRKMDDTVDELYSAIKFYLTQISREALSERESRRWTDILSFTINMEQIGDVIGRVLQDVEDKKIRKNRSFSEAGLAEISHLHERLLANLRLGMSVFLDGHVRDAKKLLEEKARFRDLEREYAASHIARLQDNTAQSIETSSLHLDLISDLKRINSHICSIAYPILDSAGVLSQTRIRNSKLAELPEDSRLRR